MQVIVRDKNVEHAMRAQEERCRRRSLPRDESPPGLEEIVRVPGS